ncbi:MAG: phosphatase PAP2 family protein [Acidobacteriota bacterium]|nr:phosphatase PAP2 family protein [Acidobacteriota bacterium]
MAGSERPRPFGLTAPLGAWRPLDLALVAYAVLSSAMLLVGWSQGAGGCAKQILADLIILGAALGINLWSRDTRALLPTLLRFCYVPLCYLIFYRQIELIWPILRGAPLDAGLAGLEGRIFHTQPSLAFRASFSYSWLSELFCFAYFAYYFFTPVVFLTVLFRKGYLAAERIALATSACFFCCYTFFWLFPFVGPHYYFPPHLGPQLYDGYVFNHLLFCLTSNGEIRAGAFPSSHIAVALLLTLLVRREAPGLFAPLALITALMLPAVVYLRAHYFLDVPAGVLTGLVAFAISSRSTRPGAAR